jgi:hypothetical protein
MALHRPLFKASVERLGLFCISHPQKSEFHFNAAKNVQLWELLTTYDPNAFRADKRNPSTVAGVCDL